MIYIREGKSPVFMLNTANTSYLFSITKEGIAEHLYYGRRISVPTGDSDDMFLAMTEKVAHGKGTTINYTKDSLTVTEDMLLELSSVGKGDLREPSVILSYEDGSVTSDFVYSGYEILTDIALMNTLPQAVNEPAGVVLIDEAGERRSLSGVGIKLTLRERVKGSEIDIYYTVFEGSDCITRRVVLKNTSDSLNIRLLRLLSLQLDLEDIGYRFISFGGNWGREMHKHECEVNHATVSVGSRAGVSSNRANPFVMLVKPNTCEEFGDGFAFNLVYSGDHYESAGVSGFDKTRFVSGINPENFEVCLAPGECFEAPEAVMTYTASGYRGISRNMHNFVRNHIVRGKYANKSRPVLLNSWEAAYFDISEDKLLRLAKKGKEAGAELFVTDDGWFAGRNSDTSSLGDWEVDTKKLPGGLERLAEKVHKLGMDFGIWVEPEMISEDSELYRNHPEYAMTIPGRENSLGRNQMLLDLSVPEVVEFVKNAMRKVFSVPGVNYVKWDMNRMFSDVFSKSSPATGQGSVLHRYYLGLYDIMKTLTEEFPDILFEGCASGGNRFDLGILCYMPQIWASDDTDAIERTVIQTGYSYGYPMSVLTSHISNCPNHQTLRNTPLNTRANVAMFGGLGLEINLCECSSEEFEAIKAEIDNYKKWREVFFSGDFYRVDESEWMVVSTDKNRAVAMTWNVLAKSNTFYRKLCCVGLDEDMNYHVYNIPFKHNIKEFGDLVNQVSPIHIKKDSLIQTVVSKFVKMDGESEEYVLRGDVLMNAGIKLKQAFGGAGFNQDTRLYQDFDSRLYYFEAE